MVCFVDFKGIKVCFPNFEFLCHHFNYVVKFQSGVVEVSYVIDKQLQLVIQLRLVDWL